jgi:hypothetical protein
MDVSDLFTLIKALQVVFPSIEKVERTDSQKVVAIRVIDFSPIRKSRKYTIMAAIYDGKPEKNVFSDYYLGKYDRIELFHIAETHKSGSCEYNDSTLAKRLIAYSNVLFFLKNIQLITIDHEGQGVLVILRSLIDVVTNMECFTDKLLQAIKGMLSFHYTMLYHDTKAKVKETLDDEEIIKNLLDKHTKTIELLLNPEHLESL